MPMSWERNAVILFLVQSSLSPHYRSTLIDKRCAGFDCSSCSPIAHLMHGVNFSVDVVVG